MHAAGDKFQKIDSSNKQKQKKVARHRRIFLKYGTFQIQESAFALWESNPSSKS